VPAPISTFDDIDLGPALLANVRRCKYTKPTPVQRYSIPIGVAGRDLMACAQTGSGKTAAFCFPIIANILRRNLQPTGRSRKSFPLALILSPTRELSSQIYDEARKFTYQTGIRPVVVYGGAPVVNQVMIWEQCGAHVLVMKWLVLVLLYIPSTVRTGCCYFPLVWIEAPAIMLGPSTCSRPQLSDSCSVL
jgi:ATP-dependent RNA helicase DDX3X